MKTKQNTRLSIPFYQNMGKLFYAVALADKKVRKAEVEKLHELITLFWLEVDDLEDEFAEDAAYQIEIVFHWLEESLYTADECYAMFEKYYKEHKNQFTPNIKEIITKTSSAIANAYAGTNKSELIMLMKLSILLEH